MKTIIVTGGAGFIGSNFIRLAIKKQPDWCIVNFDALTYAGNPSNLADIEQKMPDRYSLVQGDIRNPQSMEPVFEQKKIDAVFHFAAESHVDRSIAGPMSFIETNVVGTAHLLEVVTRTWEARGRPDDFRFVHVSTDEVYGSLGPTGYFTESTPYDPSSPYSASKAGSDHLVHAWHRTYGLPAVITNCSNNFGPYQFPEKFIPLMVLNIMASKPLPVYGDGKHIRDWLYVKDHCEALIQVLNQGLPGETYNIGGGAERRNIDVLHALCDLLDSRLNRDGSQSSRQLIKWVADRPGHDRRYAINADKIKRDLGWTPRYRFEDALKETVDWYLDNRRWVENVQSGQYQDWMKTQYMNR